MKNQRPPCEPSIFYSKHVWRSTDEGGSQYSDVNFNKFGDASLLAFIALSAAKSSAQIHIPSAILVIDTSNNAWHSRVHWLVGTSYLAEKASNVGGWGTSNVKEGGIVHCTGGQDWNPAQKDAWPGFCTTS